MKKTITIISSLALSVSLLVLPSPVGAVADWDVTGNWVVSFEYLGGYYSHDMVLTQDGLGNITGSGGYPAGGPYSFAWTITSGSISGSNTSLTMDYTVGAVGTTMHMTGTVADNGTMSGNWDDNYGGIRTGTWSTTSGAAKNNLGHLYLYEKDSATWNVVEDGAWGKMEYNLTGSTFDFVFNGHKIKDVASSYRLIYYPDPWPANNLICLGEPSTPNKGKNIHIEGSQELNTDLPALYDWNNPDNPNYSTGPDSTMINGAKIWLVLNSDVDCTAKKMMGWQPSSYLFEKNGIFYDDVDVTTNTLDLFEKNPSDWSVVPSGASGVLTYNTPAPSFNYSFTAQGLLPSTGYSLIYYANPWPGNNPGAFIVSGTSDTDGDLSFSGSVDLGMDLPHPADANYPSGAKIWLVKSADYNELTNAMTGWNPTEYLFENNLIQYDDTDIP